MTKGEPVTISATSAALRRQSFTPAEVEAALRVLPSHGWTSGWTGRRDRALLVLSQMAGLSYDNIAELTVADVTVTDGLATIRTPGGTTTLRMIEDDLICGPCALARWLHALDMTVLYPSGRVIAAVIARAAPLTSDSPHLCQGTTTVAESTGAMSLLNALNQPVPSSPRVAVTVPTSAPPTSAAARSAASSPGRDSNAGPIPSQRTAPDSARIQLPKSSYARSDREMRPGSADQLATGLEGRTRHLIEHRLSDIASF